MTISTLDAINSLRPGAKYVLRGETLEWKDGSQTEPTTSEIAAEKTKLETEYTNNKYQRDREVQYPSLQEQLDLQYWDQVWDFKMEGSNC